MQNCREANSNVSESVELMHRMKENWPLNMIFIIILCIQSI